MPRNSAARRSELQLDAREEVRDALATIKEAVEAINEIFSDMHFKDQTKIGISVTAYDIDDQSRSLHANFGSPLVLQGFLTKTYNRNRRNVVNTNVDDDQLAGLDK